MEYAAIHRKESIIFTTIDVINEWGIHAVSTREIARRQGISESTVFKNFPKKADLLAAVLEYYSLFDNDLFRTANMRGMKPREAILFYIDAVSSYYQNYPAITAITQAYDVLRYEARLEEKVKSVLENRVGFVKAMLEKAQQAGEIQEGIRSEDIAEIIISTARGICLNWRMNGYNFSLREKTLQSINMLLDAFHL